MLRRTGQPSLEERAAILSHLYRFSLRFTRQFLLHLHPLENAKKVLNVYNEDYEALLPFVKSSIDEILRLSERLKAGELELSTFALGKHRSSPSSLPASLIENSLSQGVPGNGRSPLHSSIIERGPVYS